MDFEISRSACEHTFRLYTRPEDINFVWITSRCIYVNMIRRFRSRDAGKVHMYFMRSFNDRLVRSCVSLTSVIVENQINLKIENIFNYKKIYFFNTGYLPVRLFLWDFPQSR